MENCGIIFSLPGGICVGLVYSLILEKVVSKYRILARLLFWASFLVITGLILELIMLFSFGAVRSRGMLGPAFSVAHFTIFVLGTPALANVLVLPRKNIFFCRWYVAGVLCGFLFTFLVILQYVVSEALYGINGDSGPYS